MAATDQQRLDALSDAYLDIVQGGVKNASEAARSMGFHSLKEMGDEIDRLERKISSAAVRRPFMPVRRVNV